MVIQTGDALQIDHIKGGGRKDPERAKGILRYYNYIIDNPDSKEKYQILCSNCNWIKKYENSENACHHNPRYKKPRP